MNKARLGGSPSRTVLWRREPNLLLPSHCSPCVRSAAERPLLEISRRVDACGKLRDDSTHPRKIKMDSYKIGTVEMPIKKAPQGLSFYDQPNPFDSFQEPLSSVLSSGVPNGEDSWSFASSSCSSSRSGTLKEGSLSGQMIFIVNNYAQVIIIDRA